MDDEDDGQDSRAPTIEDLARVCDSLNRSEAQYVLIGGYGLRPLALDLSTGPTGRETLAQG